MSDYKNQIEKAIIWRRVREVYDLLTDSLPGLNLLSNRCPPKSMPMEKREQFWKEVDEAEKVRDHINARISALMWPQEPDESYAERKGLGLYQDEYHCIEDAVYTTLDLLISEILNGYSSSIHIKKSCEIASCPWDYDSCQKWAYNEIINNLPQENEPIVTVHAKTFLRKYYRVTGYTGVRNNHNTETCDYETKNVTILQVDIEIFFRIA